MDMFQKLNEIKDLNLQTLLTHAMRSALTHNLVATQAAATTDNQQALQAAVLHKETAVILNALVEFAMTVAEKTESGTIEDTPESKSHAKNIM